VQESQTEESLGTRPVTTRIALRPPGGLRRPSRPTGVPRAAGIHPAHGNIQPNLTPPPTPIPPHRLRCTSPARCHLAHGFRCRHIHLTHGARLSVIPHPLHPARDTRTAHLHRRRSLSGNPSPRRDTSFASRARPIHIAPRSMGKGSAPRGFARVITSTSRLPDVDPSSPPINERRIVTLPRETEELDAHGVRLSIIIPHLLHRATDANTAYLHRRRSPSGPPPRRDISLASRAHPIHIAPRSMGKGSAP
jgi:hypothetical protein